MSVLLSCALRRVGKRRGPVALVPRYVGKDVFRASFPCSVLPRAKLSSSSSAMRTSQSRPSVGQQSQSKELSFSLTLPKTFSRSSTTFTVDDISASNNGKVLNISYNDGSTHNFHASWLLDNCPSVARNLRDKSCCIPQI